MKSVSNNNTAKNYEKDDTIEIPVGLALNIYGVYININIKTLTINNTCFLLLHDTQFCQSELATA